MEKKLTSYSAETLTNWLLQPGVNVFKTTLNQMTLAYANESFRNWFKPIHEKYFGASLIENNGICLTAEFPHLYVANDEDFIKDCVQWLADNPRIGRDSSFARCVNFAFAEMTFAKRNLSEETAQRHIKDIVRLLSDTFIAHFAPWHVNILRAFMEDNELNMLAIVIKVLENENGRFDELLNRFFVDEDTQLCYERCNGRNKLASDNTL